MRNEGADKPLALAEKMGCVAELGAADDWAIGIVVACSADEEIVDRLGSHLGELGGEVAPAFVTPRGVSMPASYRWSGPPRAETLSDQLEQLLPALEAAREALIAAATAGSAVLVQARVSVRCGLWLDSDAPSGVGISDVPYVPLEVEAGQLRRLGELGAELGVMLEVPEVTAVVTDWIVTRGE